jgi:hypothetical protein
MKTNSTTARELKNAEALLPNRREAALPAMKVMSIKCMPESASRWEHPISLILIARGKLESSPSARSSLNASSALPDFALPSDVFTCVITCLRNEKIREPGSDTSRSETETVFSVPMEKELAST